jgi:hypothetical protein
MVFVKKTLKMKKNVYNLKVEIKKWKFEKKKIKYLLGDGKSY